MTHVCIGQFQAYGDSLILIELIGASELITHAEILERAHFAICKLPTAINRDSTFKSLKFYET